MEVENLPAGFRFHPTDEELISYYLMRKVSDTNFSCKAVAVVDLNKSEPWDLPGKATMGEKEWYFFSMKDRKYPTGLRTNRATESGYWKTTGKDKEIYCSGGGVLIGMKKTLVFYKGRAPRGNKTNWVIHEYRLHNNNNHHHPFKSSKEEWVVCRVFQKSTAPKRSSPQVSQDYQEYSPPCNNETSVFNEEYGADADEFPNIPNSSAAAFNTMMMNHSQSLFPPWPSGILNNPTINNLSMNSLLLKALQLRTYQQAAAAANNTHHFAVAYNNNNNDNDIDCIPQGFSSHQPLGTTDFISSNLNNSNGVSGSRVLECMSQQQEQQPPMFDTASFGGEVV
ncbi:hypothetical protein PIB30_072166 [Stylosanthes scabra]|uniref:NAC domain-containing protein n=1 Tax=Stylosanthes scabra TaxID=79078 RepID=A0ABU6WM98_9FABA|nr:hypothetical protein [Stylosanthes scabra]